MSAVFEVLNIHSSRSLTCRSYHGRGFFCPFHLHPEFELVFIEQGYVESFVGNQKQRLATGELQFLGANVPHSFKLDYDADVTLVSKYIHLDSTCFNTLKQVAEFKCIDQLVSQFKRGAVYQLDQTLKADYLRLFQLHGVERLLAILTLLVELLKHQPVRYASEYYLRCDKSNQVMDFIVQNATDELSVAQVARRLNMSVSTLNRALKRTLDMSYIELVNHTRVSIACELLREGKLSITDVALNSGFRSSSQFNRVFKPMLKICPRQYREGYQQLMPQAQRKYGKPVWDVGKQC